VLGDRFGAACNSAIMARIETVFRNAGLKVARNAPFAGAYVAQHYGRPSQGQHVVQVEIDRALYLDERLVEPSADYAAFRQVMRGIVANLADLGRVMDIPLAAE
jgi:N-formylglutamate amidohydrolase